MGEVVDLFGGDVRLVQFDRHLALLSVPPGSVPARPVERLELGDVVRTELLEAFLLRLGLQAVTNGGDKVTYRWDSEGWTASDDDARLLLRELAPIVVGGGIRRHLPAVKKRRGLLETS